MLSRRIVQSRTSNLDLDAPGCLGNIDRLDTHLTVDNVRYAPCAYMVADDINVSTGAWASRHDTSKILSVAGSGAAPTYGVATAIENMAVKYAAGKYHTAADTTWGHVTTGDFALSLTYLSNSNTEMLFATKSGPGLTGLRAYQMTTNFLLGVHNGTTDVVITTPASMAGCLTNITVFCDRSQFIFIYKNGIYVDSKDISAVTGNLTGASNLCINAYNDGTYPGTSNIIDFQLWNLPTNPFPGVLKNRTYFDRIARERFAIVAGIADRRQGVHTFTRATPAYLDKKVGTNRQLFNVSAGWPRVCERTDANGKTVRRYLAEPQATNRLLYSEDFTNAAWVRGGLTTVSSNGRTAPNGEVTMDGIVATAVTGGHNIGQTYNTPATLHAFSVVAERGNKNWIWVSWGTNLNFFVDLLNGVIGTVGSAVIASGIDDLGAGRFRVFGIYTGAGANMDYFIHSAPDGTTNSFAGDGVTVNTWLWGAQVEAVVEHFPSSYIPTAAAAVVRNKDELSYNVRLPIVGNINDLPQTLNIGGTDYAPCAYLVADDVQADGTWLSRSTYHTNILTDGNMEVADTSYWSVGNSATISKETGTPHGGTRCIRCARNGVNNPYFVKTGVTAIGKVYRLRGYVRSDGTAIPLVYDSGAILLFTGTTSTSWQAFDVTYVAAGVAPYFWVSTSSGTTYCEWDDIVLESEAKLAFSGAGTNPTRQWDAVSRANKSIKYWASNHHTPADNSWAQISDKDYALEFAIKIPNISGSHYIASTTDSATAQPGWTLLSNGAAFNFYHAQTGSYVVIATAAASIIADTWVHLFICGDRSEKVYAFVNGILSGTPGDISARTDNLTGTAVRVGAYYGAGYYDGELALLNVWDLTTNPWPGAATNQAVMGAIARARFDQLFQPTAMRLDCEILHPNVNRQTKVSLVDISVNQLDYNSLMIDTDDYGLAQAGYNGGWAWNSSTTKGSTDMCDNVSRKLSIAARRNNARYKEDNTTIASDVSCEVPAAHTVVRMGMWADNNFQPSCLVGGVKMWRSDK